MKDSMQFKKLQRGDQTFFCRAYMYAGQQFLPCQNILKVSNSEFDSFPKE